MPEPTCSSTSLVVENNWIHYANWLPNAVPIRMCDSTVRCNSIKSSFVPSTNITCCWLHLCVRTRLGALWMPWLQEYHILRLIHIIIGNCWRVGRGEPCRGSISTRWCKQSSTSNEIEN